MDNGQSEPARPDGEGQQRYAPECYACPIGTASMAVQRLRPEAGEHLLRAGREVLLAVRSLLDVATETLQTMEDRSAGTSRVEDIPIRRD